MNIQSDVDAASKDTDITLNVKNELINEANSLIQRFASLSTFAGIAEFDKTASLVVQAMSSILEESNGLVTRCEAVIYSLEEKALSEFEGKGFFSKLFSNPDYSARDAATLALICYKEFINKLPHLIENLESKVAETPDNIAEKKEMIAALKLEKKQLKIHLKEIHLAIKDIRKTAQAEAFKIDDAWLSTAKSRHYGKFHARLRKEANLMPHSDRKSEVEWHLNHIEKMILRLEKIS